MQIERIHVTGYRSLRNFQTELRQLNVIVGENGCGKSNIYRALQILSAAASGRFARELADEGGMGSVLWGGNRSKTEGKRIAIAVEFEEINYKLAFGRLSGSELTLELECFFNDPKIKQEEISINYRGKKNIILKRKGNMITAKNMDGRSIDYPLALRGTESVLSGLRDPQKFPELAELREEFLNWRFYHNFRKDADSPLRQPQRSVLTPVLSHDASDLAAALQTIKGLGQPGELSSAIEQAFPGAELEIAKSYSDLSVTLQMPGLIRPLEASELSDGTLQYLCIIAALMTERPPTLMILNEPESSIHADLYEPLAKLIARASKRTQIILTTHAKSLASYLKKYGDANVIELFKDEGETRVKGSKLIPDRDDYEDDDEESEDASAERGGDRR